MLWSNKMNWLSATLIAHMKSVYLDFVMRQPPINLQGGSLEMIDTHSKFNFTQERGHRIASKRNFDHQ